MPDLRKDPIVNRWVIIATERAQRPHSFKVERDEPRPGLCPFCPGNEDKTPREVLAYRPQGSAPNTQGWSLRVVPNKFPALRVEGSLDRAGEGVYDRMQGIGAHEVIIETPDHARSLAELSEAELEPVFWAFRDRIIDLKKDSRFRYIMIFKNHGRSAGASLDHTHSQLIALPVVPKTVAEEMAGAKAYYDYKERCVFCDIVRQELAERRRVVYENASFVVIEPYAPKFPFETWILPKTHDSSFEDVRRSEYAELANAMHTTLRRLNIALESPPYNFMLHNQPLHEPESLSYHWHIEIMPKLSTVAGFEWGSGFYINPTSPEEAAAFLREIKDS
jgi:UDPglucose--hexose-1-phosphate uridylyltransferase